MEFQVEAPKPTISAVGVKSEQFKPLKMEVKGPDGSVIRVIELPDPREAFMAVYRKYA